MLRKVHADPHPGNVLVRPHPNHPNRPQIVRCYPSPLLRANDLLQILIDHGLYIPLSDTFRQEYWCVHRFVHVFSVLTTPHSLLWRSLFVADIATIEKIAKGWGIAQVRSVCCSVLPAR